MQCTPFVLWLKQCSSFTRLWWRTSPRNCLRWTGGEVWDSSWEVVNMAESSSTSRLSFISRHEASAISHMTDLSRWSIFSILEPDVLTSIKKVCVFGSSGNEAIFLTDDDDVYAIGSNCSSCLGLGTGVKGGGLLFCLLIKFCNFKFPAYCWLTHTFTDSWHFYELFNFLIMLIGHTSFVFFISNITPSNWNIHYGHFRKLSANKINARSKTLAESILTPISSLNIEICYSKLWL